MFTHSFAKGFSTRRPPTIALAVGCLATFFQNGAPIPNAGTNFMRRARILPEPMMELCDYDPIRIQRMATIFTHLRKIYQQEILDKFVSNDVPHTEANPWPAYYDYLMQHCDHPDTLGAYNNRKPDDDFFESTSPCLAFTTDDLWRGAQKRDDGSNSWMFETSLEEVQQVCKETHLKFPEFSEYI